MFLMENGNQNLDYSTIGKGFARTDNNSILAEDHALPHGPGKGFAKTDFGKKFPQPDLAVSLNSFFSIGKGFARTDSNNILAEDYAVPYGPGKGFAKTDFGRMLIQPSAVYL